MRRLALVALLVVAGCSSGGGDGDDGRAQIVVTSTILGDVVRQVVGDQVDVEVLLPVGADPHEFAASARQVADLGDADLVVASGAGFEQGLERVLDSVAADGVEVFRFADHVDLIGDDPHFWTDPTRTADAVSAFGPVAAALPGVDAAAVDAAADAYVERLGALDGEVSSILDAVPAERRALVTDHEVFGYFAERYDFRVIGAVIPSLATGAQPSSADVAALAAQMRDAGVRAVFTSTTSAPQLADALAEEVGGGVAVVELFTESLGAPGSGAETYEDFLRTDAQRIADALTG